MKNFFNMRNFLNSSLVVSLSIVENIIIMVNSLNRLFHVQSFSSCEREFNYCVSYMGVYERI